MLDKNKWLQYGHEREKGIEDIKGIVIHNTNSELSARQLFNYLNEKCKTSQGCSYIVDYNDVIQVVSDDFAVYSCGKGDDYSTKHLIAIEICSNNDDNLYLKGQEKAIKLIKKLMKKYNLTTKDIYFHCDFDNVHCPTNILNMYGNKKNFIRKEFE